MHALCTRPSSADGYAGALYLTDALETIISLLKANLSATQGRRIL